MKYIRFCLLIVCTLVLLPSVAQASAITEQVNRHYANMSSLKADFTQELRHKESGSVENRSGVFFLKKPLLVNWDTQNPTPEQLIISKDKIWNIFPDELLAYTYPLEVVSDSRNIIQVITGQSSLDETFSIEGETQEGSLTKLHLFPHESVQSLTEAFLWVDAAGLIHKITIFDFFGNRNTITFSNHRIGTPLDASLFTFTPPKGYEVEHKDMESIQNTLLQ